VPTGPEIRPLTQDDARATFELNSEAFGSPPPSGDMPSPWPPAGSRGWGAFHGGELVAAALVREFSSWFGGAAVPTAGIAGVAVRPEHRGTRLLTPLFAGMLDDARARGEVVSALYPTAPGIYRPLGYEIVAEYAEVEVPVEPLLRIRPADGLVLRRADPADDRDVAAHREVYDRWAAAQNGP
jgi:predicted acetyltransferase